MTRNPLIRFGLFLCLLLVAPSYANATPCSDAPFPVPLASFTSCTVAGSNDHLGVVQAALDLALSPNIVLDPTGSFCPGPGCGGSEFFGTDLGNDFEIDPSSVTGSDSFTFEQIPVGTLFISLKQGNGFEIFKVPGAVPFTLTHMLVGSSTSHISTFVPEPSTLTLLWSAGVVGLAGRRFARRARR